MMKTTRRAWRTGILVTLMVAGSGLAGAAGSEWPGFRGPRTDGTVRTRLVEGDQAGLSLGWKRDLGPGYSAVVVGDGRVITMFASGADDVLAAFDENSGDELWRYRIAETYAGHSGSHDGPIATPVLAGDRVFGLGPRGHIFAVDAATGKEVWTKHATDDLGGKAPFYGYSSSPLLSGGVLVVQVGAPEGKAITGLDPATGEVRWSLVDDGVEYQSPIVAEIGGREVVMAVANKKLTGIDPATGKELWSYEHGGDERAMGGASMVPVPAGDGRFFLMNQQETASMIKVTPGKEMKYEVEVLWTDRGISKSYVTPIYHDGHLYGISGRVLTCLDAASGEIKWRSRAPGDGFLSMAGNKLVVMTKPGSLHLAAVSPQGYNEMASLALFEEHSWSEVAISGNHLFARSMGHLARVDVTSAGTAVELARSWIDGTSFGTFLTKVNASTDKKAMVDAFIKQQASFPVIEGPDMVHFLFRGEAQDVGIVGDMIGFRREDPMQKVAGTDLFYYSIRLEPDAAVTYGFIKDYGEEAMADPLNPEQAKGLFGDVSWLAMPAWTAPAHAAMAPVTRQGRFEDVSWERTVPPPPARPGSETAAEGDKQEPTKETRSVRVYLPAGFDAASSRRYPTIYVHNGKSALEEGAMKEALDNLIGSRIEPLIAVFLMPREGEKGDDIGRMDPHLEMVTGELVPLIDARFPTIQEPHARASIGVSDGGVTAIASGFKYPGIFGRVGLQSGVFFGATVESILAGAGDERPPLVIYMDWGTYDLRSPHEAWDMAARNRDGWAALRSAGYRPAGGEVPEGVGWRNWRGHTDEMLAALFPLQVAGTGGSGTATGGSSGTP